MKQWLRSVLEGLEQPRRDHAPAPAHDGRAASSASERLALRLRKREQLTKLGRELDCVARLEAREVRVLLRILGLEALGDRGQAGMTRDERRAAGRGCFRCNHPERPRENR